MGRFFENFWIKIAALLLAVLLWFHVVTDKAFQYTIDLPISQVALSGDLILTEAPSEKIRVIVSATGKRLLQTDWKKEGLKITINRNIAGRFNAEIGPDNLSLVRSDGLELFEVISPREIVLSCDRLMEKEVPVKSRIEVDTDEGFMEAPLKALMPDRVTISGPRRHVLTVDSVETEPKEYKGVRNDLSLKVPLVYPDLYGIKIRPDTVNYFVSITPVRSRIFTSIPVILAAEDSLKFLMISPERVEVRVGGKAGVIDSLNRGDILVTADSRQADSLGNIRLQVELPPAVSLIYTKPEEVRIIKRR